jgi:hypothetical protein
LDCFVFAGFGHVTPLSEPRITADYQISLIDLADVCC